MPNRREPLFILPFDHRSSFESDLFEIRGRSPTPSESSEISAFKNIIYEGFKKAIAKGVPIENAGILVDEQFGSEILCDAKVNGYLTCCSVEKSGEAEFDFEYGADFGAHIFQVRPDYVKVLIRYNPQGNVEINERQAQRLNLLSNFCIINNFALITELLVPPTFAQACQLTGDVALYDSEIRPRVMVAAIKELQARGVEPQIWKVEGVSAVNDCALVAKQARSNGREHVGLIVLGGGEDTNTMKQWLTSAAMTSGYIGFAIGRTVWEPALKKVRKKQMLPIEASIEIAENFKSFCELWMKARRVNKEPLFILPFDHRSSFESDLFERPL